MKTVYKSVYHVYGLRYDTQDIVSEDYEDRREAQERSQELRWKGFDDWGYYRLLQMIKDVSSLKDQLRRIDKKPRGGGKTASERELR